MNREQWIFENGIFVLLQAMVRDIYNAGFLDGQNNPPTEKDKTNNEYVRDERWHETV